MKNEDSELLSAFLDKELKGDELTLVRERLSASAEWRAELEVLKRSKGMVTLLPHMSAPLDLLETLGRAAEQKATERWSLRERWQAAFLWHPWLTSGSAVAAAALLALVYFHRPPQEYVPLEALVSAHDRNITGTLLSQRVLSAAETSGEMNDRVAG